MTITATKAGDRWRLRQGRRDLGEWSLVSEDPAIFRRNEGGRLQQVRCAAPMPKDRKGKIELPLRDIQL